MKKFLAYFLSLMLLITMVPLAVAANDADADVQEPIVTEEGLEVEEGLVVKDLEAEKNYQ